MKFLFGTWREIYRTLRIIITMQFPKQDNTLASQRDVLKGGGHGARRGKSLMTKLKWHELSDWSGCYFACADGVVSTLSSGPKIPSSGPSSIERSTHAEQPKLLSYIECEIQGFTAITRHWTRAYAPWNSIDLTPFTFVHQTILTLRTAWKLLWFSCYLTWV